MGPSCKFTLDSPRPLWDTVQHYTAQTPSPDPVSHSSDLRYLAQGWYIHVSFGEHLLRMLPYIYQIRSILNNCHPLEKNRTCLNTNTCSVLGHFPIEKCMCVCVCGGEGFGGKITKPLKETHLGVLETFEFRSNIINQADTLVVRKEFKVRDFQSNRLVDMV